MRLFQRLFYFICLATKTKAECTFANQTITFFKRAGAVNTHEKSNTNPALVSLKSCAQIHRRVGEDKVQRWDVYNAEVMMLWNFYCLPSRLSVIESFAFIHPLENRKIAVKFLQTPQISTACNVGGGDLQRKLFAYHDAYSLAYSHHSAQTSLKNSPLTTFLFSFPASCIEITHKKARFMHSSLWVHEFFNFQFRGNENNMKKMRSEELVMSLFGKQILMLKISALPPHALQFCSAPSIESCSIGIFSFCYNLK